MFLWFSASLFLAVRLPASLGDEKRRMEIREFAEKLGIPCLVHFTRWENLDGIVQNGLCPKILLEDLPYDVTINDEMRLDGHEDSVSLSIAFPNYKMFYRYRSNTQSRGWAVIAIHPSVLWEYECAFCKHNAADSRISRVDIDSLKTIEAFKDMYKEDQTRETRLNRLKELNAPDLLIENEQRLINESSRSFNKLEAYDPTDPQAEVLIFDIVSPDKITAVVFESSRLLNEFKEKYPNIKAVLNRNYFSARCYVRRECWKQDVDCVCKGGS